MRSGLIIVKILLGLACIYLSFRIIHDDSTINKLIGQQIERWSHYKNDPLKDSSTNRKLYALNKQDVDIQIKKLEAEKHPEWYRNAAVILPIIAGWLLRDVFKLFKRRAE